MASVELVMDGKTVGRAAGDPWTVSCDFGSELEPLTPDELARVGEYEDRTHHIAKMWNYYLVEGRKAGVIPGDWEVGL